MLAIIKLFHSMVIIATTLFFCSLCLEQGHGLSLITTTNSLPRRQATPSSRATARHSPLQHDHHQQQRRRHLCNLTQLALSGSSSSSGKEEEIAKLEEQLRRLKEEAEQDEQTAEEEDEAVTAVSTTSSSGQDYVGRGPAKRPVRPMEEMMSESWKASTDKSAAESEDSSSSSGMGGTLTTIVGAVVFAVLLGFFAQVPVGQEELSKYQAIKTSTQIDLGDINPVRIAD